jgi:uncharacterized membrane protein (DUF2068 family)
MISPDDGIGTPTVTVSTEKPRRTPPSFFRRVRDWAAWEFGRPIEVTPAIRFIIVERFVKATVLIVGGIALVVFGHGTNIHQLAENLQDQLNLASGRGWWRRALESVLVKLGHLSVKSEIVIAVGAVLYGALEAFEGFGLLRRRRWAEYLVLIATAVFLPLEIEEILRKPTVFKAAALLVNVLIIVYLVWRKRLFLERPGEERADATTPPPRELLDREPL